MTSGGDWRPVAAATDLERAGKLVVDVGGVPVLVLWNGGAPVAMNDTCIHKGRSLSEGVLLNGRLVCAGHQWAFDLTTGFCRAREQYQPVHAVRIEAEQVQIDAGSLTSSSPDPTQPKADPSAARATVNSVRSP